MIKTVDLFKVTKYSYGKLIELGLVVTCLPLIIIFTSTLLSNNIINVLLFMISIIITTTGLLQFIVKSTNTKKTFLAYTSVLILVIMIISSCIQIGYYSHIIDITYFKIIIFIFSLIFFWINANTFLDELKKFLFSRFTIHNKIKLYTPKDNINENSFANYWSPVDPFKIKFLNLDSSLITESQNTYISIRRSTAYNTKNAFQPIFNLIVCQKLLGNNNAIQKYFNTIYIILVIINFIYFFASLFVTKTLLTINTPQEFVYLFMVFMIIINLSFTIYLFIKHLKINSCDEQTILSDLQKNTLTKNLISSIDSHYLTLNNETKFQHDAELKKLKETNNKLINKLESIYQIATPILFLSQITLSIALIHYFIKESLC